MVRWFVNRRSLPASEAQLRRQVLSQLGTCLASSFSANNSPAFQRWVLYHKKSPSPVRDERSATLFVEANGSSNASFVPDTGLGSSYRTFFPAPKAFGAGLLSANADAKQIHEAPSRSGDLQIAVVSPVAAVCDRRNYRASATALRRSQTAATTAWFGGL